MNNNWISVTNEPKVDQWIFIYVGASNPVMGCYKGNGKVLDNSLNDIWDLKEEEIKFWQPLPLPPTEEIKSLTKQEIMPVLSDESISAESFKNEPVNFLMVNAMLYLNEEQLIELRDKLIARTPKNGLIPNLPASTIIGKLSKIDKLINDQISYCKEKRVNNDRLFWDAQISCLLVLQEKIKSLR